jgi:hypothetical protein
MALGYGLIVGTIAASPGKGLLGGLTLAPGRQAGHHWGLAVAVAPGRWCSTAKDIGNRLEEVGGWHGMWFTHSTQVCE